MRRALVILCVLSALLGGSAAAATVDERAARIEREVWSPYCPGRLLAECTTAQAERLRAGIRERLRDGATGEEVVAWLRDNYGDGVLARPDASRAEAALWLLPFALVALGVVWWRRLIRSRPASAPDPSHPATDDPWIRRVRADVEKGL